MIAEIVDVSYEGNASPPASHTMSRYSAEPICGTDFCDGCGDCLSCYDCDPCPDGMHTWVVYVEERAELELWLGEHAPAKELACE